MTAAAHSPKNTIEQLLNHHADDIAFVADKEPATTLDDFIEQLGIAAKHLQDTHAISAEDLDDAAIYLSDAQRATSPQEQQMLLKQAAERLRYADDAVEDYRLMV